jgi:SAM-dependent methyltransferase
VRMRPRSLRSMLAGDLRRLSGDSSRTQHDATMWSRRAQEGEFRFHQKDRWRQSPAFMEQTVRLFDHFGFSRTQYAGKTVIDLGAGSKLRTKYFLGADIIAVEPLANRFISEIGWCDLTDAIEVYSTPAEILIDECVDRADLVISINVLDHCYDFEKIVANAARYLKVTGLMFLSFDKHDEADEMHPLQLTERVCQSIFGKAGLVVERLTKGLDGVLPENDYGHGPYCLNYWLRRGPHGS